MKDLCDLAHFFFRNLFHLALLALALFRVVLSIALSGQITAKTHRDRTGSYLCETRCNDDARTVNRTRQSGRQRKGNSQSVGHANDNVAHGFARGKVSFDVTCLWHCVSCA